MPRTRGPNRLRPGRLSVRDLAAEALAGLAQRPSRSIMTMLGTVLGIGAFVAILGFTATAQGQISKQFSILSATQVSVTDIGPPSGGPISFPAGSAALAMRIRGVTAAGVYWEVSGSGLNLRISSQPDPGAASAESGIGLQLTAADPEALAAMGTVVRTGRLYDRFAEQRAEPVAVLGALAAQRLGITQLTGYPAVFVDGVPYTVIGIASSFARAPGQQLAVIIPTTTALARYCQPGSPRASMLITTRLGAAQAVARQIAIALRPDAPRLFQVSAPADPTTLQTKVSGAVNSLFLILAAISLLIGALGIVNTTLVAVLERTAEIGLRRALGARRSHIAAQFLAESLALGTMGGLIGTAAAVLAVLATAIMRHQTAVIPPWAVFPAPAAGSLIGLIAGAYPAARAARLEPVTALQR
jgi:putative ABC transport system permease protein